MDMDIEDVKNESIAYKDDRVIILNHVNEVSLINHSPIKTEWFIVVLCMILKKNHLMCLYCVRPEEIHLLFCYFVLFIASMFQCFMRLICVKTHIDRL